MELVGYFACVVGTFVFACWALGGIEACTKNFTFTETQGILIVIALTAISAYLFFPF